MASKLFSRIFGKKVAPNVNENPVTSTSQKANILAYLLEGNPITSLEALDRFGSLRLGARIADIKKEGYPVESKFVTTKNGKRVKAYYIPGTKEG